MVGDSGKNWDYCRIQMCRGLGNEVALLREKEKCVNSFLQQQRLKNI